MSKLPTAEEFFKNRREGEETEMYSFTVGYREDMIEFAKLHCEAALKAASENADTLKGEVYASKGCINKESILNAYPLNNIK